MEHTQLIEFIRANPVGVLSTQDKGGISGAAVYYIVDNDGTLYFNTKKSSRKIAHLIEFPKVAFTVFQTDPAMTLQMQGTAEVIEDITHIQDTYSKLLERVFSDGNIPPLLNTKMGMGETVLVKVTPSWMRLADFSKDKSGTDIFTVMVDEK